MNTGLPFINSLFTSPDPSIVICKWNQNKPNREKRKKKKKRKCSTKKLHPMAALNMELLQLHILRLKWHVLT
jgi:hypothetical protein